MSNFPDFSMTRQKFSSPQKQFPNNNYDCPLAVSKTGEIHACINMTALWYSKKYKSSPNSKSKKMILTCYSCTTNQYRVMRMNKISFKMSKFPWPMPSFTDFFQNSKFPWFFSKFPDFSLTLNFPDFSLTSGNPGVVMKSLDRVTLSRIHWLQP